MSASCFCKVFLSLLGCSEELCEEVYTDGGPLGNLLHPEAHLGVGGEEIGRLGERIWRAPVSQKHGVVDAGKAE